MVADASTTIDGEEKSSPDGPEKGSW